MNTNFLNHICDMSNITAVMHNGPSLDGMFAFNMDNLVMHDAFKINNGIGNFINPKSFMLGDVYFDDDPDWVSINESDGREFYGYDDGEGRTDWYDSNGNYDSTTDTPSDEECDDNLYRY